MNISLKLNGIINFFASEISTKKKEEAVPGMLLQASIFPRNTPVSKMVEFFAFSEKSPISIEFKKAIGEIEKGASTREALENLKKRNNGRFFSEAIEMLLVAEETGMEMNSVFREKAEEIIEIQSILKERSSMLLIQKATLLLGGGIIVPIILGLVSGMALSFNSLGFLELMEKNAFEKTELLNAMVLANQFFIAEFAFISSLFLSFIEGRPRKAILYSVLLVPLGLACFFIALNAPII